MCLFDFHGGPHIRAAALNLAVVFVTGEVHAEDASLGSWNHDVKLDYDSVFAQLDALGISSHLPTRLHHSCEAIHVVVAPLDDADLGHLSYPYWVPVLVVLPPNNVKPNQVGDIVGQQHDKYGHPVLRGMMTDVSVIQNGNYNMYSLTRMMNNGWKMTGDAESIQLSKLQSSSAAR